MQSSGRDAITTTTAPSASRYEQLQARAARWSELCNELSAHAAELQGVRDALRPRLSHVSARERELENQRHEIEQQAEELKRRWKLLERCSRGLAQRGRALREREQNLAELESSHGAEASLREAHLANETEERLAATAAWVEQLDRCAAEFEDGARRLEDEHAQLCHDLESTPGRSTDTRHPADAVE